MKDKKTGKKLRSIVILAVLLVLFILPGWLPVLSEETRAATRSTFASTFGGAGSGTAFWSLGRVLSILAMIAGVALLANLLQLLLTKLPFRSSRTQTAASLLVSLIKYAAVLTCIIWGLSLAGVNITGIFASLGIVSLIIGFGAQSLIEDIVTGIFIIFEGQYSVGDVIVLDDFRGIVRRIGVRTTSIEDAGGNLKIINNSDIRNLQNRSANESVAVCDFGVPYSAPLEKIEEVIRAELEGMWKRNEALFLHIPEYRGVQSLGESAVILRVIAYTDETNIFDANRALNREVKLLLDRKGIEIPFPQIVVHAAGSEK